MTTFIEVIAGFKKKFSKEEKETYRMLYGDNENEWPEGDSYDFAPMCISISDVVSFNEHKENDMTTIDIRGGSRFGVKMPYEKFKELMSQHYQILEHAI